MKKLFSLLLVTLLAFSFAACAPVKKDEKIRVKCPACGYEFDVPVKGMDSP
jgi:hypothetical protein